MAEVKDMETVVRDILTLTSSTGLNPSCHGENGSTELVPGSWITGVLTAAALSWGGISLQGGEQLGKCLCKSIGVVTNYNG